MIDSYKLIYPVPTCGKDNNIRIYHECEDRIEKSVPRITVWHQEACRVMTKGDPDGRIFNPTHTRIMDSLSSSQLLSNFEISFQKSLNTLKYNFI